MGRQRPGQSTSAPGSLQLSELKVWSVPCAALPRSGNMREVCKCANSFSFSLLFSFSYFIIFFPRKNNLKSCSCGKVLKVLKRASKQFWRRERWIHGILPPAWRARVGQSSQSEQRGLNLRLCFWQLLIPGSVSSQIPPGKWQPKHTKPFLSIFLMCVCVWGFFIPLGQVYD